MQGWAWSAGPETQPQQPLRQTSDVFRFSAVLYRAVFLILLVDILVGVGSASPLCARVRHQTCRASTALPRSDANVEGMGSVRGPAFSHPLWRGFANDRRTEPARLSVRRRPDRLRIGSSWRL